MKNCQCDFEIQTIETGFNKISGMYAVGISYSNKVIRLFIRAVRQLVNSLARGEKKGSLARRQPDFYISI